MYLISSSICFLKHALSNTFGKNIKFPKLLLLQAPPANGHDRPRPSNPSTCRLLSGTGEEVESITCTCNLFLKWEKVVKDRKMGERMELLSSGRRKKKVLKSKDMAMLEKRS